MAEVRLLSVRVKLTRSGIPTIIPAVLRRKIRKRDDAADRLVKMYISWFEQLTNSVPILVNIFLRRSADRAGHSSIAFSRPD